MKHRVVMLGASGAVGQQVVAALGRTDAVETLTLLNRRALPDVTASRIVQHVVGVLDATSYAHLLAAHDAAICTFGVGEPSAMSREEFVRIDKTAVLDFATACKAAGVRHFQLLGSVGSSSTSRAFYLRVKGELCDALQVLQFDRLSIFQPSMILTPTNRYGFTSAVTLAVWPKLNPLLAGPLRQYRGIRVDVLGSAIAANVFTTGSGVERLHWPDFTRLGAR